MVSKIVPTDAHLIPDKAELVFEGVIYDVYHWQQELFDGSFATFEMLRRTDTVVAICIVDDALIVLDDEQPHRGLRKGFPAGGANAGEDPLTAIKREVLEETGYRFKDWTLVSVKQPNAKIEHFVYVYVANDGVHTQKPEPDAGERINLQLLPFGQVRQLVLDNVGYMGESLDLFREARDIQDLLSAPEYFGKEVERYNGRSSSHDD